MKPQVYIETTVVSYLTAWPSRDLIRAAHQQLTREWWEQRRSDFDLFVSEFVLREAGSGDPSAAAERLAALADIPVLSLDEASARLAQDLIRHVPLPERAAVDAFHIAVSVVSGMDFLLS